MTVAIYLYLNCCSPGLKSYIQWPQRREQMLMVTQSMKPAEGQQIVAEPRKHRPVAPHLAIYRMQINHFNSPFNRITGSILSGGLYCFGATYFVSPLFGCYITPILTSLCRCTNHDARDPSPLTLVLKGAWQPNEPKAANRAWHPFHCTSH
jgi:hypothetical protein